MTQKKLFIFDLDGTLADAYKAIFRSLNYVRAKLGYSPVSFGAAKANVGNGVKAFIESFFPKGKVEAALKLYRAHHKKSLKKYAQPKPYAKMLLSSKTLVTHFGITLHEGYLADCKLFTINPTPYHNALTETVKKSMDITNLGIADNIEEDIISMQIEKAIQTPLADACDVNQVYNKILENLDHFYHHLMNLPPLQRIIL